MCIQPFILQVNKINTIFLHILKIIIYQLNLIKKKIMKKVLNLLYCKKRFAEDFQLPNKPFPYDKTIVDE